jgi:hypothetical protein
MTTGSSPLLHDALTHPATISSPRRQLMADHPDLRWDVLGFRRELEGATAH